MPGRLQDRIAIITGSSSGIGRATAFAMSSEGAKIVCSDLQEGSWRTDSPPEDEMNGPTHERINSRGGKAIFVKTDVTDPDQMQALIKTAVQEFGRLDIMVNNAGFALESRTPAPIWETPIETYQQTINANVHGVFYGTKFASAQMITQTPLASGDRGWILNAASVYGLVGTASAPAYCTSKGAVANLTRAAALDCAPWRVHVNAVNPGYVATHMTDVIFGDEGVRGQVEALHPFRGMGRPEDVAKAYVFLASDDAQWMTGVNMPVDGGFLAR
ncbi:uncharacterized protein MYCFIDRAFT_131935 [Pseudocercospora fijiensis CIRAD86]|uniref:Uncharacterized protein n=1 Tax=Pseudocercospora fijiensis (strain CIRAD86) TaxID=383855 RepID=M3BBJ2_PSEFD|nr:uncharacterized protein MYCFIDRAFT_131935 [Pseudocercospora fijiensis CIRAD86]EME86662.1 hypothetical protein MYCFIDRAFT_131935 [Pseudocercospora fijiensis CIRAD86]